MDYQRTFGKRSRENLKNCHPVMIAVVSRALQICVTDFSIIEGHRPKEEQDLVFRLGNSKVKWPNSAHNQLPALAVDIIPYPFNSWNDLEPFKQIADAMFQAAAELEVEIRWGGDFNRDGDETTKDSWDKPHFELHPWRNWKKKK